jgi:arylformamidase
MTLVDITRVLHDCFPAWPDDMPYQRQEKRFSLGDATCRISALRISAHAGTHVDAPAHLCGDDGAATTVDQLDLELLCGPARVVDLRGRAVVEARDIQALPDCPSRLLLRTDNSDRPYDLERFVALSDGAASSLVSRACLLVGVDGPSVDPAGSLELLAHRLLLQAGVIILEGLDLGRAAPGDHELLCLPLALRGADGAPARAVLRELPRRCRVW